MPASAQARRPQRRRRSDCLRVRCYPCANDVPSLQPLENSLPNNRSRAGAAGARFTLHFTPTYSSWINLVERWLAELTTKWLQRSAHRSVPDLVASIRTWITNRNDNPKPYVWHKIADEILDSLASYCQRINNSGD